MNRLKILYLLFSVPFPVVAQSTFFTGGNICSDSEWNLVFNDEFDGDSLDRNKWINYFPDTPDGSDQCEFCRTHGNKEGQIFTDTNLLVSDGTLKLIARKQTATWYTATRDYTSGLIHSKYEFKFMYGRFETRCKIPSGRGLMSAFWMFGGTGDGIGTEIDAFEIDGSQPNHHGMGVIKWHETEFFARHDCTYAGNELENGFHVFTVDWDPFFVTFYVDGKAVFVTSRFYTINGTQVTWCCVAPGVYEVLPAFPSSSHDFVYLNLSLGVGIGEDAPNSHTVFPHEFEIDYIRVYQRDPPSNADFNCEVLIYPNPALTTISVKKNKMTLVRIENLLGEMLFSKRVNTDETIVDVSFLKQGIYFVEVQSEDGTFANKFIKE